MKSTALPTRALVNDPGSEPAPDRVRIVSIPGTCGGWPRIDGYRITVEDIAIWHERMGMSADEIVSAYPTLKLSDVYAALAYYYAGKKSAHVGQAFQPDRLAPSGWKA